MSWLLGLFTGGTSSILTYVLGASLLVALVGGGYLYVEDRFDADAAQIAQEKAANATLLADKSTLEAAVQGANGQIADLKQNIQQIAQENDALRTADQQTQEAATAATQNDQQIVQTVETAETSKVPAAVAAAVVTVNAQNDCIIAHFSDFSGLCKSGVWVAAPTTVTPQSATKG